MIASNLVWAVLSILLVFSLLGVTHSLQTINLTHVLASEPGLSVSITGSGLLMAGVTLSSFALTLVTLCQTIPCLWAVMSICSAAPV